MGLPFCFEAVLFDLDGTLVATDRFWVDAARAGARRAFAELGVERELPSAEEWLSLVGLPLEQGFAGLFPDLEPRAVRHVMERCVEEEEFALKAGRARLLPHAEDALTALRERGARVGIASNCGRDYLSAMLDGLGLARWVDEARCLDSAGVRSKADMLADLLGAFGTRSAVMVGDRAGDRDAAHANGLPHVHCARGFARAGEDVACEAVIEDLSQLVPRLEQRAAWILEAARCLGLFAGAGPRSLGVTGRSGAGKTLFARDLARVLERRGVAAGVVALEDFVRPGGGEPGAPAADRPLEHVEIAFDLELLSREVLEPHARGSDVELELARPAGGRARIALPAASLLILEGPFLLHPRLRARLDRVVQLCVSEGLGLRRVAGRDASALGPEGLARVRRDRLPLQRAFDELYEPAVHADLVLAAENALGPAAAI